MGEFEGFSVASCHIFLAVFSDASITRRRAPSIITHSKPLAVHVPCCLPPRTVSSAPWETSDTVIHPGARKSLGGQGVPGIKYGCGREFQCLSHLVQICKMSNGERIKQRQQRLVFCGGHLGALVRVSRSHPCLWQTAFHFSPRSRRALRGKERKDPRESIPLLCFCLVGETRALACLVEEAHVPWRDGHCSSAERPSCFAPQPKTDVLLEPYS